ncbi:MAG: phage protease [Puniceicoccales bacterium]|jgi:hypothetical protein|nr:phage protease [Puniceicoccales bacterium]
MSGEWLKLADFGEYQHPKGIQVLDENSAKAIVDSFLSFRGRLMRKFRGIPVFIGHPDDPEFSSKNGKVYGTIENLRVDDGALWILLEWTDVGEELFRSDILRHLSPRWLTVRMDDGRLFPRRLLSVGLTNHPNIKCEHLPKAEENETVCADVCAALEISENDTDVRDFTAAEQSHSVDDAEEISRENFPLHTVSQTENLAANGDGKSNCEKILALVFERMGKFSENYGDAWMAVKRSHPALFTKF